jgi:iron complex transport system ATP-binding protein
VIEIVASNLIVRRADRAILDSVSLRAQGGEFVGVIGANGAGKSTLLAVLAALLAPDSGSVVVNGRPSTDLPRRELARLRAYLPQNPRCEWPISVQRLIALGLTPTLPAFRGLPQQLKTRVAQVLAECDLTSRRDQAATTLSGGELARAMLGRALVGDPDIVIADEPIANLDPKHALDTLRRLSELARNGKLVIAALHDLTLAARYASRLIVLDRARLVADGPPERVLTPALLRTAFEVDASVNQSSAGAYVDYVAAQPT